ncbi:hypothetical protein [Kitasatospora sp. NPDC051914]|uniref:hypothetical protein n=1 Tax=Kitasatospora sp. NPDC051914 TaxID=3154945 RepID=UPI00342B1FA7
MPYPLALALTLLVEVPLYTAALTCTAAVTAPVPVGPAAKAARVVLAGAAVNLVTHPVLWWLLRQAADGPAAAYWTAFALAETSVCLVEAGLLAVLLRPSRPPLPLLGAAALTANAGSVLVGLLASG